MFWNSHILFFFFAFVGLFLDDTMHEYVVVQRVLQYCIAVPQAQHITAQRNQPGQSRKASRCRSECDNVSKQTELERASTYVSSSIDTAR